MYVAQDKVQWRTQGKRFSCSIKDRKFGYQATINFSYLIMTTDSNNMNKIEDNYMLLLIF